jgi:ribosome-associated translation inhibitor RaiA
MFILTTAEKFSLTIEERKRIEDAFDGSAKFLEADAKLRVFLKRSSRHGFEGTLTVHTRHEDIVYTQSSEDVFELVHSLASHLHHEVASHKEVRLEKRRQARKAKKSKSSHPARVPAA